MLNDLCMCAGPRRAHGHTGCTGFYGDVNKRPVHYATRDAAERAGAKAVRRCLCTRFDLDPDMDVNALVRA
jgi:hypothetical protein